MTAHPESGWTAGLEAAARVADDFATAADATFLAWKSRCEAGTEGLDMAGGAAIAMAHQARSIAKAIREKLVEPSMQHVAYFDGGEFHWMSGIRPRDCELFAKLPEATAKARGESQ